MTSSQHEDMVINYPKDWWLNKRKKKQKPNEHTHPSWRLCVVRQMVHRHAHRGSERKPNMVKNKHIPFFDSAMDGLWSTKSLVYGKSSETLWSGQWHKTLKNVKTTPQDHFQLFHSPTIKADMTNSTLLAILYTVSLQSNTEMCCLCESCTVW